MIPDESSLEFLIEHLKFMIQEQSDKKIEKISDLTEILSDFMSTFLVVVDALISSSQRRFRVIDDKLKEFEDLLLSASVKGLTELSEFSHATEKNPIKFKKPQPETVIPKKIQPNEVITENISSSSQSPAPPPIPTEEIKSDVPSNEGTVAVPENLEVETLAALAFQERKTSPVQSQKPAPNPLGSMSLKVELLTELKKKFGAQTKDTTDMQ